MHARETRTSALTWQSFAAFVAFTLTLTLNVVLLTLTGNGPDPADLRPQVGWELPSGMDTDGASRSVPALTAVSARSLPRPRRVRPQARAARTERSAPRWRTDRPTLRPCQLINNVIPSMGDRRDGHRGPIPGPGPAAR